MKKLTAFVASSALLLLALPARAAIFDDFLGVFGVRGQNQPQTGILPTSKDTVFNVVNTVINWLFAFLLLGAVLVIIIAAFNFLTAGGDAEKTKKGRDYITYAMVAVIVGFLAKAAISLVAFMLGVGATGVVGP